MTAKEKLYYLLTEFQNGVYDTDSFCDQFTVIYDTETDYDSLSKFENELFNELSEITARYSSSEDDLKIPNMYFNEKIVKSKVEEVLQKLQSK